MKNKIKIFRKLVRCASIALLSFSMAGCGADFLDTTPTNNISGSSIWTKATLAEQAVIGVYNVFLDQYCPNSGILDSHRIPWDAYSSVMTKRGTEDREAKMRGNSPRTSQNDHERLRRCGAKDCAASTATARKSPRTASALAC